MRRREFLRAGLAASVSAMAERGAASQVSGGVGGVQPSGANPARQYYELRKYLLRRDAQAEATAKYLSEALIPAMNRMGIGPVGAFSVDIGPETPMVYVLLPSTELETLVGAGLRLREDEAFLSAAQTFWNAPDTSPAFERVESTLLIAFEKWPQLVLPPPTATKGKRMFQMRRYESASDRDHVRKVEMFQSGEFEAFERAGFWRVFFGDALIGERLPQLTYMLSFPDLEQMNALWDAFRNDAGWKKLQADPRFSYDQLVVNITNLVLSPTAYSQG
ncbi:MAG TPA: NIPSNAP family protein [Acidobacteriaceae bacterium]|nr:NIPSNAP family protein [Acidobacteriaceae bacterium]